MQIKALRTTSETVTVEVDPSQVFKRLRLEFRKVVGVLGHMGSHVFINGKNEWTLREVQCTSHEWTEDKVLCKATEEEIKVWEAFTTLSDFFYGAGNSPEKTS